MKNTRLKTFASVVMTVAALLVPVTALAGFGPSRPTLTYGPGFTGTDKPVFNSIVNNPGYGDERAFLTGRDASIADGGGGWTDPVNVTPGKEYALRIYVHNNANDHLNASGQGVATGTKIQVALPTQTAKNLQAKATIHADNATPKDVYDTLDFNSTTAVSMSYVPGSAKLRTNTLKDVKLSDDIVKGGATVGSDALNGKWLGCFGKSGWVTLKVKINAPVVEKPAVSIVKTASSEKVAPGDKLDYTLTVTNSSKADATNIVVRDAMPAGVTVNGATLAVNGGATQAITNYQQLFSKDGLNIGTLKAGQKAVIVVKTTVNANATGSECAINLLNTAYVKATNVTETSSSASVGVSKTCEATPTLPDTGAEGAAAAALGFTAMGTATQAYLRSKRGLVKAVRKTNR